MSTHFAQLNNRQTRRGILRLGAGGGIALFSAGLLAACGGSAAATTSSNAAASSAAPTTSAASVVAVTSTASSSVAAASTATTSSTAPVASAAVAASTTAPAKALVAITIYGVVDPQISSQLIVADKQGLFKANGLTVTPKLIQSGADIGPLIAGGTAPMSFESNITVISTASHNVAVKIIAPDANIGGTQGTVMKKGLTIQSAKDLEGKKVGMPTGAGVIIAWRNMAQKANIDLTKIQFVNLQPADSVAAMAKGDVDMMSGWEPWMTKSLALGGSLLFTGKKSFIPGMEGDVDWMDFYSTAQVTPAFEKQYGPDAIVSILKAITQATDVVNNDRANVVKLLSPDLQIPVDQLTEIMGRNVYTNAVDALFVKSNDEISALLLEQKAIPSVPSPASYTDWTYLKQVAPNLVTAS